MIGGRTGPIISAMLPSRYLVVDHAVDVSRRQSRKRHGREGLNALHDLRLRRRRRLRSVAGRVAGQALDVDGAAESDCQSPAFDCRARPPPFGRAGVCWR